MEFRDPNILGCGILSTLKVVENPRLQRSQSNWFRTYQPFLCGI